jgi:uncharacterized protein YcbK (DUF882 family)
MSNNRRNFLKLSLGAAAALMAPAAFASLPEKLPLSDERRLRFYHLHTGEKLSATYWAGGEYIPTELTAINHLLRDFRTGDIATMDKQLLDLLYVLQQKVDKSGAYHIISAYRSPQTNAALRKHSKGVAKRSLHMQAKAIDIRLPGVELKHLRRAALDLHAGGVGYYPKSNFIHVDTGRPRFW